MPRPIHLEATVERHDAKMPRYVVVPASVVASWKLEETTVVEGTLNGIPLGRRTLKRWGDDRWFVDLPERWCRRAGILTGDQSELVLKLASTELPKELAKLLAQSAEAKSCWDRLTASQQRMVCEDVLAAKRPETRARRARKALASG